MSSFTFNKFITGLARFLSAAMSPLLMPTYGVFLVLWTSILCLLPTGTRVTVIPSLVQGYDDVNEARMLKDASEALYAAAKESVNVAKLKARIVEAQINREWYQQPQT